MLPDLGCNQSARLHRDAHDDEISAFGCICCGVVSLVEEAKFERASAGFFGPRRADNLPHDALLLRRPRDGRSDQPKANECQAVE